MSISDDVMWDYYRLLLLKQNQEIEKLKLIHPMESKKQLAKELTALFYGDAAAENELKAFAQVFSKGEDPDEMAELNLNNIQNGFPTLVNILFESNLFDSKGQIRRLIAQGAVKVDGEKVSDGEMDMTKSDRKESIIKAGKKIFLKVTRCV